MTDPLSVVSGIAGVISLAGIAISQCYRYGCGVADAPDEAKRFVSELIALSGVLVGIQCVVKQADLSGHPVEPSLEECKTILAKVALRLQKVAPYAGQASGKRTISRLLWPLRKGETLDLLQRLERNKSSLSLALDSLSVEALVGQSNILDHLSDSLSELAHDVKSDQARQERHKVLDWLSDHHYEAQYQRGYQLHCPQTCQWLLKHHEVVRWAESRSALLWMHGPAGSGKTVATSHLIHHLSQSSASPKALLAYFYYDASTIESLTPQVFFGAIVKQVCSQLPQLPEEVMLAYQQAANQFGSPKQPELGDLKTRLTRLMDTQRPTVIVIDGLDESPEYHVVCDFLTTTVASGRYPLRVFVSSRPEVDLRRRFEGVAQIPVPELAIERDIGVYIQSRIANDQRLRRMGDDMKRYVVDTLTGDSHGMFRWVQCQLDEISRLRTDGAIKRALTQLPSSIEESYSRILRKIAPEDELFAQRTLLWLAHASAPLSLSEIAEAAVLETDFDQVDPDSKFNDPTDVLDICGSLVAYSPASRTARIAHHSVREFLTQRLDASSKYCISAEASHFQMAETCLSYLLLDEFSVGPLHYKDFSWTLTHFPLLQYAAQNWPFHVQNSGAEKQLVPLITKLLTPCSNPKFLFWFQVVLYDSKHGWVGPSPDLDHARPLYYAASYGLSDTVRHLIEAGADLNERAGRYGGTALHAAVWRNRPDILAMLIEAGANWKIPDYNNMTPGYMALRSRKDLVAIFPDQW